MDKYIKNYIDKKYEKVIILSYKNRDILLNSIENL